MSNKLMDAGSKYVSQMKVSDVGILKVCVFSLGIFTGVSIKKGRRKMGLLAFLTFLGTYGYLMNKFLKVLRES